MMHLRSISLKTMPALPATFPFTVPVIRSLTTLEFNTPMTFLVGENGSGKSTLLEAIAAASKLVTVGSSNAHEDESLRAVRQLADRLKLVWSKRNHRGFFLRSEDFFGYARRIGEMKAGLQADLKQVDEDYEDRSEFAKSLARMSYSRELAALQNSYGEGLDVNSHGESFFKLFQARFVPGGLYLLDEPEAPLSPMRQLALMAMLKTMLDQDAQFIIATHSPILLAYPGATIYTCDGGQVQPAAYDDLEHVNVTRDFLLNPQQYLRHLLE
jgi:predicted ATPase